MDQTPPPPDDQSPAPAAPESTPQPAKSPDKSGFAATLFTRWHAIPLYLRILGGVLLGVVVGLIVGPPAEVLDIPSKLVLRLLG